MRAVQHRGGGQASLGGIGIARLPLARCALPAALLLPLAILGGAALGAAWGAVPGWLQARRGSHVVITTIMFNFIAAALLVYLLVNVLIAPGQMAPETRRFADGAALAPAARAVRLSPVNLALPMALLAALAVWLLVWRTPWGYGLRVVGANPDAPPMPASTRGGGSSRRWRSPARWRRASR
jgi:simple sugar transport system permease protein